MTKRIWRVLQVISIVIALMIIYHTYSDGFTAAMSGHHIDILLSIIPLFVSICLVGLSIYFSIKAKKR